MMLGNTRSFLILTAWLGVKEKLLFDSVALFDLTFYSVFAPDLLQITTQNII